MSFINNSYFECGNDVSKCCSLTILQTLLDQYSEWMTKEIEIEESSDAILNHFHHLLICHPSSADFDYIYQALGAYKCDIKKCQMFARNYRDKEKYKDHNNTLKLYNVHSDKIEQPDDIIHTISIQQIFDRIHSHYFHSYDIGLKFSLKENSDIQLCMDKDYMGDKYDNNNTLTAKRTFLAKTQDILSTKHKVSRCSANENRFRVNFGEQLGSEGHNEVKSNEDKDDVKDEKMYSFGYRFYYWDYYFSNKDYDEHNFNHETCRPYKLEDWYIQEKYDCLKDELLNNDLYSLSKSQYESLLQKAVKNLLCEYGKTIQCKRDKWDKKYETKKGDIITLEHILAMMTYCNYDQLQHVFSATYRKKSDESDEELKKRHSQYFWMGMLIREAVECFGDSLYGSRVQTFWSGIHEEILFQSSVSEIKGVLSTSSKREVGINFSQFKGLVLEIGNGSAHHSLNYFSCAWLSDFANESEYLFVGGLYPLQFVRIIHALHNEDYVVYLKALNIINKMFDGETYEDINLKDIYFGKLIKKTTRMLICHYLSGFEGNTQKSFQSMPRYVDRLLCHQFEHRKSICIDWGYMHIQFDSWGNKGYEIAKKYICVQGYEWINIELICDLFYNLNSILFKNGYTEKIKLSHKTMNHIYKFLKTEDSCINVIKIQCNDGTSEIKPKAAIDHYNQIFDLIGFSLSILYGDWLVIKRNVFKKRIKQRNRNRKYKENKSEADQKEGMKPTGNEHDIDEEHVHKNTKLANKHDIDDKEYDVDCVIL
eukprot:66736_1